MRELKGLGYHVPEPKVLDGRAFVPQHRERIFIVGFRDDRTFSFEDFVLPDMEKGPRLGAILHPEDGSEVVEGATVVVDGTVVVVVVVAVVVVVVVVVEVVVDGGCVAGTDVATPPPVHGNGVPQLNVGAFTDETERLTRCDFE